MGNVLEELRSVKDGKRVPKDWKMFRYGPPTKPDIVYIHFEERQMAISGHFQF